MLRRMTIVLLVVSVVIFGCYGDVPLLSAKSLKPSINLCCEKNLAHKSDPSLIEEKLHRCDPEPEIPKSCQQHDDKSELQWNDYVWNDSEQLKIKASDYYTLSSEFKCSGRKSLIPVDFLVGTTDFRIQKNGSLIVIQYQSKEPFLFKNEDFCVAFSDAPYYDYDYDNNETEYDVRTLYNICHEENPDEKGDTFISIFYPISLFISCFFVLLTIIVYWILEDLRNNLFGKLTLGFLVNVCISYFFIGVHYCLQYYDPSKATYIRSGFCVFLGYIVQHTFIAIFFWTSAMAINCAKKFSGNILLNSQEIETRVMLFANILYCQGVPLSITIITLLIDSFGSCDMTRPNMGYFTCFLGSEYEWDKTFADTPQFLYFYLIISILLLFNIGCFMVIAYSLASHWSTIKTMQTSDGNRILTLLRSLVSLFIIMGIPFTFDIISSAIEYELGRGDTFEFRVVLDILNLFTGPIMFGVLCWKPNIIRKLSKRFNISTNRQDSRSSQQTQEESINLRKFSTVSGISSVSIISTKTQHSEMVISEEDEDQMDEL